MDAQNKNPIPTLEEIEAVYNRVKKHEEEIAAFAGYIANVKKVTGSHLTEIEDGKSKLFQAQEASAAALEAKSQELINGLTQTVSNANLEVQNKVTDFQTAKDMAQEAASVFKAVEDKARSQSQQLDQEQSGLQERIKSVNELNESLRGTLAAVQLIEAQTQQTKKLTEDNAAAISNLKENCEHLRTETNNRAEEATARKIQLEDEFKGLQEAIATAQSTLTALSEGIKGEKANVATVTAQFQQQFSEAQEKRLNEFNDRMKELRGDIDTFRALASSDLEEQKKKLDKDIEDKIVLLDSKVGETLKLMEEKNHKASKLQRLWA